MTKRRRGIPGLSFSWNRALGITAAKQRFARRTGIPTSRQGMQRKLGRAVMGGSSRSGCMGCLLPALVISVLSVCGILLLAS